MKEFDAIIIGFGKGGKTLATELAQHGWKVAVIERSDKMYGGTCINTGCIPTKALIHQAELATQKKGLSFEERKADYRKAIAFKNNVTDKLRKKNYDNLAGNPNITVYTGEGQFVSPEVVRVTTQEEAFELTANPIFINTGAETVMPPINGIQNNPGVFTSTTIMELEGLPRQLIIIGGGYIGLEFASMYASFGSEVIVLESSPALIPREDRDIAASVQEVLEKKGIRFILNANVQSVTNVEKGTTITYKDTTSSELNTLKADAILLATGRKPNTENLNLKAAGVEVNERGAIIADEHLKTTTPHIRVIGDVKGGLQFTYVSLDDYRIIREDLFGNKDRMTTDREPISYSVFIDPPLSRIGMSEEDAKKKNLNFKVNKFTVSSIPRVHTIGKTEGMLKAIIDADTKKILGCTLFCPESSEIINIVAIAMKTGQDYTFLRDFIFTHPSISESFNDLFKFKL